MKEIKILALGDIVRTVSCDHVCRNLWKFRKDNGIDMVVANGENASENGGVDRRSAEDLLSYGVDVITTGNHVFKNNEAKNLLDSNKYIIRPANYPEALPGYGYTLFDAAGKTFLIINVMGVVDMAPLADPFSAVEKILEKNRGKYDISVLDIHAEATSEKRAIALYFDGRIDVIFGTHTHVTTADEQILPRGTAYITDLGMCGPDDSVLGIDSKCIIEMLRMHTPVRFTVTGKKVTAHGVIFTFGADGKVKKAERVTF